MPSIIPLVNKSKTVPTERSKPAIKAINETIVNSTSFGAPTELELQMATLICEIVPNIELVRMVNSGTEATMSAIRLARGYTGKEKFIKFEGCYHGHADYFLIKAGSGALTLGVPTSPGVTTGNAADTLVAEFNNIDSIKDLIAKNKNEIVLLIHEKKQTALTEYEFTYKYL